MASTFRLPTPHASTIAIALLPVAIPAAYLLYLKRQVSQGTTSCIGRRGQRAATSSSSEAPPADPVSLPADVKLDESQWVLSYERVVSHSVLLSSLVIPAQPAEAADNASPATQGPTDLLKAYLRVTHESFSWTPQAFILRACIGDVKIKRTFDSAWIRQLAFAEGDIVNGVYRVAYVGSTGADEAERVELALDAPPSYKGPDARGLILSAIEPVASTDGEGSSEDMVIFVNETWMWRRNNEKPTLLELPAGKWFHSLLAGWLVIKGVKAMTSNKQKAQ